MNYFIILAIFGIWLISAIVFWNKILYKEQTKKDMPFLALLLLINPLNMVIFVIFKPFILKYYKNKQRKKNNKMFQGLLSEDVEYIGKKINGNGVKNPNALPPLNKDIRKLL